MKKRYNRRRRQHYYAALQRTPAYLHPILDDWGQFPERVPFELWMKASQTCSAGRDCSDAFWFGLVPDDSDVVKAARARQEAGEPYKGPVVALEDTSTASGVPDTSQSVSEPPTTYVMRSEDWGCEPGRTVLLEHTGTTCAAPELWQNLQYLED